MNKSSTVSWNTARPQHAPKQIRRKHVGITYPGPNACQARVGSQSKYFAYAAFGGVKATHRAAEAWVQERMPRTPLRVSASNGKGGIVYVAYGKRGIWHYALNVPCRDVRGTKRCKTFFIGTENTWTPAREREAWKAARRFRLAYETWTTEGGIHPIDHPAYAWSAKGL